MTQDGSCKRRAQAQAGRAAFIAAAAVAVLVAPLAAEPAPARRNCTSNGPVILLIAGATANEIDDGVAKRLQQLDEYLAHRRTQHQPAQRSHTIEKPPRSSLIPRPSDDPLTEHHRERLIEQLRQLGEVP